MRVGWGLPRLPLSSCRPIEGRSRMQAARNAIRLARSSLALASPSPLPPPTIRPPILGSWRDLSQSAAAVRSAASFLDKQVVTDRVLALLKSFPFVDPSKVSSTADFKNDLRLDMLESVEVIMAAEEEFAVDIANSEADKISTAAHLIDYITAHPQAK